MNSKALQRTILGAVLTGGMALGALAQIPVPIPPLPGLDVRFTTSRPPAPRRERRIASPGQGYVWVNGFWHSDGGRWQWVQGRWDRPAIAEGYWIPARYIRTTPSTSPVTGPISRSWFPTTSAGATSGAGTSACMSASSSRSGIATVTGIATNFATPGWNAASPPDAAGGLAAFW